MTRFERPQGISATAERGRAGFLIVIVSVLAMILSCACSAPAQEVDHLHAFLIARGNDYTIHVMPAPPGHMLVYSIPSSGVMKPFFLAGPMTDVAPHRAVERVAPREVRIMGLLADDERLYVIARSRSVGEDPPGPSVVASEEADMYRLYMFWLADASLIQEQDVAPPQEFLDAKPTIGRGPLLRREQGQIDLFGTEYAFEGKVLKQIKTPDGRTFTPPPLSPRDRLRNF